MIAVACEVHWCESVVLPRHRVLLLPSSRRGLGDHRCVLRLLRTCSAAHHVNASSHLATSIVYETIIPRDCKPSVAAISRASLLTT